MILHDSLGNNFNKVLILLRIFFLPKQQIAQSIPQHSAFEARQRLRTLNKKHQSSEPNYSFDFIVTDEDYLSTHCPSDPEELEELPIAMNEVHEQIMQSYFSEEFRLYEGSTNNCDGYCPLQGTSSPSNKHLELMVRPSTPYCDMVHQILSGPLKTSRSHRRKKRAKVISTVPRVFHDLKMMHIGGDEETLAFTYYHQLRLYKNDLRNGTVITLERILIEIGEEKSIIKNSNLYLIIHLRFLKMLGGMIRKYPNLIDFRREYKEYSGSPCFREIPKLRSLHSIANWLNILFKIEPEVIANESLASDIIYTALFGVGNVRATNGFSIIFDRERSNFGHEVQYNNIIVDDARPTPMLCNRRLHSSEGTRLEQYNSPPSAMPVYPQSQIVDTNLKSIQGQSDTVLVPKSPTPLRQLAENINQIAGTDFPQDSMKTDVLPSIKKSGNSEANAPSQSDIIALEQQNICSFHQQNWNEFRNDETAPDQVERFYSIKHPMAAELQCSQVEQMDSIRYLSNLSDEHFIRSSFTAPRNSYTPKKTKQKRRFNKIDQKHINEPMTNELQQLLNRIPKDISVFSLMHVYNIQDMCRICESMGVVFTSTATISTVAEKLHDLLKDRVR